MNLLARISFPALLAVAACGGSSSASGTGGGATTTNNNPGDPPGCSRGMIEADLKSPNPMAGPGVDPSTGALMPLPAGAVMSSTYFELKPDMASQMRFSQLFLPVLAQLEKSPGLLGWELGTAATCGTARTLTVWQDDMSMLAFVMSPAHSAAVAAVSEVSRGGSVVVSWGSTDATQATWQTAAQQLAAVEGPFY